VRRRKFIGLLGGAAVWPLTASAQQGLRLPTIGFLGAGSQDTAGPWVGVFAQRLRELGWIEGRTINIDLRWAEGRKDRSAEIAAEFVRIKVDLIVTYSAEHALIAKRMTATIPIVATLLHDPRGTGLTSIAHPGGNFTGISSQNVDLTGKRVELLREVVPNLRRLAILFNVNNPTSPLELDVVQSVGRLLGVEVLTSELRPGDDIASVFAAMKGAQADALYVIGDPLTFVHRTRINILAVAARLATVHATREFVEAGGLMSYGPNYPALFRRAAEYVDKILRGTKPGDLPVEQPTRYDLVLNLTTAKALGLDIPPTLLARADEVIE
jgi:putative tryptophan/tyrosine transport system substrate-binding protein